MHSTSAEQPPRARRPRVLAASRSLTGAAPRASARMLVVLLGLSASWLALPSGVALGIERQRPALDGRLIVTKQSIGPGERVGMRVRNTGRAEMLLGLGATVERRRDGRWVLFQRACPTGCPEVALTARPGETVGPRYADLRDSVRLPPTAPPGRYRLTKEVEQANQPRREGMKLRAMIRVRTARLILTRRSVEPGQRVGMKIRNTGRRGVLFGLGATVERWEEGRWVDAQDEVCPPPDGCPVPDIGLRAPPGETVGPRYRGRLHDTIRFPREVPEGLYRLSKDITPASGPRRREAELQALLRAGVPSSSFSSLKASWSSRSKALNR